MIDVSEERMNEYRAVKSIISIVPLPHRDVERRIPAGTVFTRGIRGRVPAYISDAIYKSGQTTYGGQPSNYEWFSDEFVIANEGILFKIHRKVQDVSLN